MGRPKKTPPGVSRAAQSLDGESNSADAQTAAPAAGILGLSAEVHNRAHLIANARISLGKLHANLTEHADGTFSVSSGGLTRHLDSPESLRAFLKGCGLLARSA